MREYEKFNTEPGVDDQLMLLSFPSLNSGEHCFNAPERGW